MSLPLKIIIEVPAVNKILAYNDKPSSFLPSLFPISEPSLNPRTAKPLLELGREIGDESSLNL